MNEKTIRELANKHGMNIYKRITTGSANGKHFATFELSDGNLQSAYAELRGLADKGSMRMLRVDNQEHHDYNKPFIEIQSIWCEP